MFMLMNSKYHKHPGKCAQFDSLQNKCRLSSAIATQMLFFTFAQQCKVCKGFQCFHYLLIPTIFKLAWLRCVSLRTC